MEGGAGRGGAGADDGLDGLGVLAGIVGAAVGVSGKSPVGSEGPNPTPDGCTSEAAAGGLLLPVCRVAVVTTVAETTVAPTTRPPIQAKMRMADP